MVEVSEQKFEKLVGKAIDALPEEHLKKLDNVAIVVEDTPNQYQRIKARLPWYGTLFGLYEGIPQYKRGNGYSFVLPDKITIFRLPLCAAASDEEDLEARVKNTVWHEVAHHYGLGHQRIHELENKDKH